MSNAAAGRAWSAAIAPRGRRRQQEERYLGDARWRLHVAHDELYKLGPIGRRAHRAKGREIENRIERFNADIAGHEEKLARLSRAVEALSPEVGTRAAWERENRLDLGRLATLDRHIGLAQPLERTNERGRDLSIEL